MINVKVEEKETEIRKKYPCLMEIGLPSEKIIVLFYEEKCGIVVNNNPHYQIGHYDNVWCESDFKPFSGKVILSNEQWFLEATK